MFLKRVTAPQEESKGGPAGGVPEVSIVTRGDDSSMDVIAPEDLPAGQAVEVEDGDVNAPDDPVEAQAVVCICVLVHNKET